MTMFKKIQRLYMGHFQKHSLSNNDSYIAVYLWQLTSKFFYSKITTYTVIVYTK